MRDALPPARDLFGDEGAAAFLQTEQSYNVQLPSSASSMGSSPCESRGSSPGLQHRLATQRRPLTGPALGQSTRARPTSTLCTASRLALVRRAVRRDLRLELPLAAPKPLLSHTLGTGFERPALQSPFTLRHVLLGGSIWVRDYSLSLASLLLVVSKWSSLAS